MGAYSLIHIWTYSYQYYYRAYHLIFEITFYALNLSNNQGK